MPSHSAIVCRRTTFEELWLSARPLMEIHALQFAIPNLESYLGPWGPIKEAQERGELVLAEAVVGNSCVGYIAWMIGLHASLGRGVARMGPWFVDSEYRGSSVALRLFKFSLTLLRAAGARYALPTLPLRRSVPRDWLHRLGARPFEITWLLEL